VLAIAANTGDVDNGDDGGGDHDDNFD